MVKKSHRGKLIVLEGIDGSGKSTQTSLLLKRLKKEGYKTIALDFPQYREKSAGLLEEYLAGKYGLAGDVNPYAASIFYAVDRYDVSFKIADWLKKGIIVVADRYVASNIGHQGGKIRSEKELARFILWLYELEYDIFRIPKPDRTFFLSLPPKLAQELCEDPERRKKKKKDIHERDPKHFLNTDKAYHHAMRMFPKDFTPIECLSREQLLSPQEIHEKIWKDVKRLL